MSSVVAPSLPYPADRTADGRSGPRTVRVAASEFAKCLARARISAATGDAIPVLHNLALVVRGNTLLLETYNMLFGMRQSLTTAEFTLDEDAVLLMKFSTVSDICAVAKGPTIAFTVEGDAVRIESGAAQWSTRLSVQTWPTLPFRRVGDAWDQVPRTWLAESITKVKKAAAQDSVRPALQLVDIVGTRIRAADSIRLHQVEMESTANQHWQVPLVRSQGVIRFLNSLDGDMVRVGSEDGYALVWSEDRDVLLSVVGTTAAYPSVDDAILVPSMGNTRHLVLDREALIRALESVRVTSDDLTHAVMLDYAADVVRVSSADTRGNSGSVSLPAAWNGRGDTHSSMFSCDHLLDLLKALTEDTVALRFGADTSARASSVYVHEESSGFRGVLSQVRRS